MKEGYWLFHRSLIGFLAFAVILTSTLAWLGWRLLEQDRALEHQRLQEKLNNAADLVTSALLRQLSENDARLATLVTVPESQLDRAIRLLLQKPALDFFVLVVSQDEIRTYPAQRLLYYPIQAEGEDPSVEVFAPGEYFELKQRSYENAIAFYRDLARSKEATIRAGALLRLARTLRKSKRMEEALKVYEDLAELSSARVNGLPAELVSQYARAQFYKESNRPSDLRRQARGFYSGLHSGRWKITRAVLQFYAEQGEAWLGGDHEFVNTARGRHFEQAKSFAAAVEFLWEEWARANGSTGESSGRRNLGAENRSVFATWKSSPARMIAFITGPRFVETEWLDPLKRRDEGAVKFVLTDPTGQPFLTQFQGEPAQQVVRTGTETGLPWTLHVASADPGAESAQLNARRQLLLAGFIAVTVFFLISSWFVARAVGRDLEVAQLKSDFVAAVSHEFRTPLTSLRQITELLTSGRVPAAESRQKYYQILSRESQRLSRLVEGLLDFGRIEADASEPRLEPVDASALIREVVQRFREEIEDRGYTIELTEAEPGATIEADRESLIRALWNLLDNAVKYSPNCQTIWVNVEHENEHLAVRVRDRGMGIPPAEQKEIFKKFVRGTGAQTASIKGTGIGLSMVRHIVAIHGGKIVLESQPGVGSAFTILLPIKR